jgi:fido (protein-threonine AMPylation protein)
LYSMATDALLADLDIGPETCIFLEIAKEKPNIAPALGYYLPFVEELDREASKLQDLLDRYNKERLTKPHLHNQLITFSVAKWIHYTNKIESAGFSEEGDTQALIGGASVEKGSQKEREVLQTLDLLRQTYSASENLRERAYDIPRLIKWHGVLLLNIHPHPGAFRKTGAETENLDGSKHLYPHHSLLKTVIGWYGHAMWELLGAIDALQCSKHERIAYIFALAAFAQFHFVDIHPFVDGNGRMCRFISKYLLDSLLPLPFPMFLNRDEYLQALIGGRGVSKREAPILLARLLMREAIVYYETILHTYYDRPHAKFLASDSEEDFADQLKLEKVPDVAATALLNRFSQMSGNVTEEITVGSIMYRIKKLSRG